MTGAAGIDPSYLEKGTRIGAYEVIDKLGVGGFGYLWKVRREGRFYALKIGRQRLSGLDAEDREHYQDRLDREIAALKTLHHPNIVRVLSFDWWPELESGFPYMVMDFVDGHPLYEWRERAAPSLARVCSVFEKLAAAIEHMHALGIHHRDFKSDNVLVRGDAEPVVIDFGIARPTLARELTRAASVGTVTYYAPEYARYCDSAAFARGDPFDWRPTTDLHAVGYMLYRVLTGSRPFPRDAAALDSEAAILLAIKTEIPPHPSDLDPRIPRALGDVAMALLEKEPAKRPQSAKELAGRLREAREAGAGERAWTAPFDVDPAEAGVPRPGAEVVEAAEKLSESDVGGTESEPEDRGVPPGAATAKPSGAKLDLPTRATRAPFEEGEELAAEEPRSDAPDPIPTAIREARARLAASQPRRGPGRLAIAGGVAVAVVAVLIVLAASAGESKAPARLSVADVPAREPAASPPAGATAAKEQAPTRAQPSVPPSAQPEPQPPSDEAQIDAALAREFGRPRVLPDGRLEMKPADPATQAVRRSQARKAPPEPAAAEGVDQAEPQAQQATPTDPPWLMRSTRLASASPAAAQTSPKPRGVPLGAHLKAKLLTNLDSRTVGSGPVEAVLVAPVMVRGEVALPVRTMVYGTASEAGGRFNVRFTRLRLPDDAEVEFEGLALARDDGKPGLAAARRIQGEPERQPGLGAKIAKGTGNLLLDTITGGVGQDVVRNAGQAALGHEKQVEVGSSWATMLDAGVVFDVWVEKSF